MPTVAHNTLLNEAFYYVGTGGGGTSQSIAMTGASAVQPKYLGLSFWFRSQVTLAKIRLYCVQVLGTLGTNDITYGIYADSAGSPTGSALVSANASTPVLQTGTWVDINLSVELQPFTNYWLVITNTNAVPASNYPSFRISANGGGPASAGIGGSGLHFGKKGSVDGSTWASTNSSIYQGLYFFFADDTISGFPFVAGANDLVSKVYATREVGVQFTTPINIKASLSGIAMLSLFAGSPSAGLKYKIYEGTTFVAETAVTPLSSYLVGATLAIMPAFFSSPVTLKPNTSYRITLAEDTNTDPATSYYALHKITLENTATAKLLKPFNGTLSRVYYDGSNWTVYDYEICSFSLIFTPGSNFLDYGPDNYTVPAAADIRSGTTAKDNGTTITGTLRGSVRITAS